MGWCLHSRRRWSRPPAVLRCDRRRSDHVRQAYRARQKRSRAATGYREPAARRDRDRMRRPPRRAEASSRRRSPTSSFRARAPSCSQVTSARSWCYSAICAASRRSPRPSAADELMATLREYHGVLGPLVRRVRRNARPFRRRRRHGVLQRSDAMHRTRRCALSPCRRNPARPRRARRNAGARGATTLGFGIGLAQGVAIIGQIGFEHRAAMRRSARSRTSQPACAPQRRTDRFSSRATSPRSLAARRASVNRPHAAEGTCRSRSRCSTSATSHPRKALRMAKPEAMRKDRSARRRRRAPGT